jgi:hypothetical protein
MICRSTGSKVITEFSFLFHRWVDLTGRTPPVALILSGVRVASDPSTNLLVEPVIVANVLTSPTVKPNKDIIYITATTELRINGTGFVGAKKLNLYFNPPILNEVAYEIVSPFPLSTDQVLLRLRHGYKWREDPGILMLIGIDTGGGPARVNGDEGYQVATVAADPTGLEVPASNKVVEPVKTVVASVVNVLRTAVQTIYDQSPKLHIKGDGFSADEHSIILDLATSGQAPLRVKNDFTITKDDSGLTLKLLANKRCVRKVLVSR